MSIRVRGCTERIRARWHAGCMNRPSVRHIAARPSASSPARQRANSPLPAIPASDVGNAFAPCLTALRETRVAGVRRIGIQLTRFEHALDLISTLLATLEQKMCAGARYLDTQCRSSLAAGTLSL